MLADALHVDALARRYSITPTQVDDLTLYDVHVADLGMALDAEARRRK